MSSTTGPVVVGYDGSKSSAAALDWGSAHAVREHAPLRVVEVSELIVAMRPSTGSVVPLDVIRQSRVQALDKLAHDLRLRHPDLQVSAVLIEGNAAPVLVEEAGPARLVVLGTRGAGGWAGMLLGSVSVQVAAHAVCPVVVVPPDVRPRPRAMPTVVVGVDGSKVSADAIEFAFQQAEATGARVLAVHSWHTPMSGYADGRGELTFDRDEIEAAARLLVAESLAGAIADHPDVIVATRLYDGHPARSLLTAGESADLIVVGSRGRGGFTGLLLGSVSQGVLHHAHCPVAIVR